jgi:Transposase DDE domain
METTTREQRGLVIAATARIRQKGNVWLVPSQSNSSNKYAVSLHPEHPHCTCPDHELNGCRCKHIFAATIVYQRELFEDGTIVEKESLTLHVERKTYPQQWSAYNAAQTTEKSTLQVLLHDLCKGIPDAVQAGAGRPRLPLGDGIFCACLKVYSQLSSRRFTSDLCDAQAKGYINRVPHFNSVLNVFDAEGTTEILTSLIEQSAAPLAALETKFAIDSTAFSGCRFDRWFDTKFKQAVPKCNRAWVKAHCAVGCLTNVVTAVTITDKDGGDSPMLEPLMQTTLKSFSIVDLCADKAYLSVANLQLIEDQGINSFIPFKVSNTKAKYPGAWNKAFHFFNLHREEFLQRYHARSNAESTFSAIKRKFGDSVKAKNDRAMRNEVLAKIVCHNLSCLIHAMQEFGIDPDFTCTNIRSLAHKCDTI